MSDSNKQSGSKKGGVKSVAFVAYLVIVVIAVVVIVLYVTKNKKGSEDEKRNVVVTEDNVEEVIAQMEEAEAVAPGYYTVTMNNIWHFANGSAVSEDAHVENVVENTNDVYFDIFLASDEENAIYKSPVIPRGSTLENIALDTPLEAGTYDCICVYHLVDEDQNTLTTLRVTVTLIIEG